MSEFVVVDASVAFKWLVEEENSDKATALTRLWDDEGTHLAAPPLMPFEVANALHRRVVRGDLSGRGCSGSHAGPDVLGSCVARDAESSS